jgi:hypothetical protein
LKCGFQKKVCTSKSPTFFSRKPLAATYDEQKMKSKNEICVELPPDFSRQIRAVFNLVGGVGKTMEDMELLEYLVKNGTNYVAAKEIVIFLPITFVRCLLTEVNWPETFLENTVKAEIIERRFSETESYQIVMEETKKYFFNDPDRDIILNIAGRSSEFGVINQLLLDNPATEIKDVQIIETVINRDFDGSC